MCTSVCRMCMHTKQVASFHGSLSFSRASHDVSVSWLSFQLYILLSQIKSAVRRNLSVHKNGLSFSSKVTQTWASVDAIKHAKSYGLPMTIRGVLRGLKVCQLSWKQLVSKSGASDGFCICHLACKKLSLDMVQSNALLYAIWHAKNSMPTIWC